MWNSEWCVRLNSTLHAYVDKLCCGIMKTVSHYRTSLLLVCFRRFGSVYMMEIQFRKKHIHCILHSEFCRIFNWFFDEFFRCEEKNFWWAFLGLDRTFRSLIVWPMCPAGLNANGKVSKSCNFLPYFQSFDDLFFPNLILIQKRVKIGFLSFF